MIDSIIKIDEHGTKRCYNSQGQYHNENGPAVIYANGEMYWCINGYPHRIDGPSSIWSDGIKSWYLENFFVRDFSYD